MTTTDSTIAPRLVPVTDTAAALGIGRTSVYQLLDAGELVAIHVGRRRLVTVESIDAYVARLVASA